MNGNEREQEKYPRESRGAVQRAGSDVGPQLQPERAIDRAEKAVAATLSPRGKAFEAIDFECQYQDRRHPETYTVGEELLLLRRYADKAIEAWVSFSGSAGNVIALNHIRKIAAMAVRAMENHGTIEREDITEKVLRKVPSPDGEGAQIVEDGMREQDPTDTAEGGPKF